MHQRTIEITRKMEATLLRLQVTVTREIHQHFFSLRLEIRVIDLLSNANDFAVSFLLSTHCQLQNLLTNTNFFSSETFFKTPSMDGIF